MAQETDQLLNIIARIMLTKCDVNIDEMNIMVEKYKEYHDLNGFCSFINSVTDWPPDGE